MKTGHFFFFGIFILLMVGSRPIMAQLKPAGLVNPFIGTGGHGHTFPGAVVPFGMVQLSPDTKIDDWDHCSGYHYSDSVILGFSHTHLSGTGIGDYGDIRFMPITGPVKILPGDQNDPDQGYASRFSHKRERAMPGYYMVWLEDYKIKVELTATERAGMQQYTDLSGNKVHVLIDLKEAITTEKVIESRLIVVNDSTIAGLRRTDGWADDHYVFFYSVFSRPFLNHVVYVDGQAQAGIKEQAGDHLKIVLDFDGTSDTLLVKTGISAVDMEGARKNLEKEMPDWNFDSLKVSAFDRWNRALSKIKVEGGDKDQQTVFYTALYHTMLAPNIYSDVDDRYRGHDGKIYQDSTFTMYTVFSIWDTFRALHPLFTIIERKRTVDFIRSMLDFYQHDSHLPVWELAANETFCMIGYHSVSVITDAYKKGIKGFDAQKALKAMAETANKDWFGLKDYKQKGYIPSDKERESVSKTLEYAYDDWCIAQMAEMTGDDSLFHQFIRRGQYYKNLFDKSSGFFRAKANGAFIEPFDPKQVNFNLTEANTWQYNFFVPQDINTLISLLGGDKGFNAKLDELFTLESELTGRKQADITGLIGQYAHGNEPSHHIAYLYNFSGQPWKTQYYVDKIMKTLYRNAPDGLAGNEDCGQMSAWYVMSALGFYAVTPGTDEYIIGTPLFPRSEINLENGKRFVINAKGRDHQHFYVKNIRYQNADYPKSYLKHKMVMDGGVMELEMTNEPVKDWAVKMDERPQREIRDDLICPVPYFMYKSKTFKDEMSVSIRDLDEESDLFYKRKKDSVWRRYDAPLKLVSSENILAKAQKNGKESFVEEADFLKVPVNRKIKLETKYSNQYNAGGDEALIDFLRGGDNFGSGRWQGYEGEDLIAVVDLGQKQKIHQIGIGFLQDQNAWIFMPLWVRFEVSNDGVHFKPVGEIQNTVDPKLSWVVVKDFKVDKVNKKARYVRVYAKNRGVCPSWHKGYPHKAWIFSDEIWIK